ncbi:SAP domain-containing protein [Companilactobacillus insicii]|uniref:SAP domain-containing protein n=1 Tax=Companilactobacillus insicii TaxID=1732567 RepID=UPI000F78A52D|nr:SAP domain-containing protein [Companilactobacillus insicii]
MISLIKQIQNHQIGSEEFKEKYLYKTELQEICRKLNLNSSGTKNDLNQKIIRYLNNEKQISTTSTNNKLNSKLTNSTKIIDGVKLNQELRNFMAKHYGLDSFKFSKQMAVTIRTAKLNNNSNITVQTLIDIQDGKTTVNTDKDDVSYQWNQFVKDFCADPINKDIDTKLVMAAKLWKIAKTQKSKKYTRELFEYLSYIK